MLVTKQLSPLTSNIFFFHSMEVNGDQQLYDGVWWLYDSLKEQVPLLLSYSHSVLGKVIL